MNDFFTIFKLSVDCHQLQGSLTALNVLVRGLSLTTQFKIEFRGPFYGPEISLIKQKNPVNNK